MKILLSDYDRKRLDSLSGCIAGIFPDAQLTAETDSLMAGKDCFSKAYDIVFATLDDRRLDGLKLKEFARRSNPQVKFILCASASDLLDWSVIDEDGSICEGGVDGTVSYPVTAEKLLKALSVRKIIPFESSRTAADSTKELDDDLLLMAAGGRAAHIL